MISAQSFHQNRTTPAPSVTSGVTELVLASEHPQQLALLLPMVAHLSNSADQRWITWLAPTHISRALLEAYGVNVHRIRLIHPRTLADARWITWDALAAGNSHCVIANLGRLTERELRELETAATSGQSQGLLLRSRQIPGEWQAQTTAQPN